MAKVALLLLFLVQIMMSVLVGGGAAARPLQEGAADGGAVGMVTEMMLGGVKSNGNPGTHFP
uniref:ORW1943Ba0047B01.16 protein n=1 Tax=Oryza rufipogon TaxID=4529 RepID=U6E898_ORYRU|nr:ORW1943Ba0047B01.16 [Oryza rufipogon]